MKALLPKEVTMNYDGLLELVKNRRSIRRFKPGPIPDEYVDKILQLKDGQIIQ